MSIVSLARQQAIREKMAAIFEKNRVIVSGGICPECGRKLKANLAITGWYMCVQKGSIGFRADSSQPSCGFQCFTE